MKMEAEAAANGTTDDQLGQSTINIGFVELRMDL